jgi:hypothetical protein
MSAINTLREDFGWLTALTIEWYIYIGHAASSITFPADIHRRLHGMIVNIIVNFVGDTLFLVTVISTLG